MTVHRQVPSLVWLVLLFIGSRLLYLFLIHPDHLLTLGGDGLYQGTIAKELLSGLHMPFTEYRAVNYSGGSLVVGALASCFFLLMGPTVFALKLAPLLLFTLALICWFITLQRHASHRVAIYFALLFIFSPPLFTSYTVAAVGFHSESIFFTALSLFLLCEILSARTPARMATAFLGFTAGFGLWFTYIYGLTLLAMLGFWFWQDKGAHWRTRVLCFAIGFVVGFSPWIIMNAQNHFAGLVIDGINVWEHFGLDYLWDGLSNPRRLAPYEFFANIASQDPRDLYRRAVNLLYSLLFLAPILTAGVLHLKTVRSEPAGARLTRLTLEGFGILYAVVFALAVQFSDFKAARFNMPLYPFLLFFLASAITRIEDALPPHRTRIQTVFLSSLIVLAIGGHSILFSLVGAGSAFSAKGYSYGELVEYQLCRDDPQVCVEVPPLRVISELARRQSFATILDAVSPEDRKEMSLALARFVAEAFPFDQGPEGFLRARRLVPVEVRHEFHYLLGRAAMERHKPDLSKAIEAVAFARGESAELYRLAVSGIYRRWPYTLPFDVTPESLIENPAGLPAELQPEYWRAVGLYAALSWRQLDPSLVGMEQHLRVFLPRLDPSAKRYVLQGIGMVLFPLWRWRTGDDIAFTPREAERLSQEFHEGIFEGIGMALSEEALHQSHYSWPPRIEDTSATWKLAIAGLSASSVSYVRAGRDAFTKGLQGV